MILCLVFIEWKQTISWLNPAQNTKLIDVASGTGDICKLFSNYTNYNSNITCIEPNNEMFDEGKKLNEI